MMQKALILMFIVVFAISCKQSTKPIQTTDNKECKYAKGLKIESFSDYHKVTLNQIVDNQKESFIYILHKENYSIPDSLKKYYAIQVPIRRFIATSSTHIPPLDMLGVETSLIGFPNLNYISSPKTRIRINQQLVEDIGQNQALNIEKILMLKPDLIMGFGINEVSKDFDYLKQKNIPIIYNGEWRETHPLGKAEWLKLFGLLFDKYALSEKLFNDIENNYNTLKKQAKNYKNKPQVMSGGVYQNVWYAPKGDSWGAELIADAGGEYLWKNEKGQGSVSLSFEDVLIKAKNADYWIGPSYFESYQTMIADNPNYKHFKAFQQKNVYSYTMKKGETGAIIYFESGVYEPHLILKDLIQIFHKNSLNTSTLNYLTPLND